jgi:hypothetical protein
MKNEQNIVVGNKGGLDTKFETKYHSFFFAFFALFLCFEVQSRGSPGWRSFGTPMRESRESRDKKAISMWAPWRGAEYTIGSKVVAYF